MNFVDLCDTPEQAEEMKRQMHLLGWRWYTNFNTDCGAFFSVYMRKHGQVIRPTRKRETGVSTPWMWRCSEIDALFDDPVSCAVALEIKG